MGIFWKLELLNQVNVDVPLEDEVFEWPNDIPDGSYHVLVGKLRNFKLVFYDFHPLDLIGVVVPNSLG